MNIKMTSTLEEVLQLSQRKPTCITDVSRPAFHTMCFMRETKPRTNTYALLILVTEDVFLSILLLSLMIIYLGQKGAHVAMNPRSCSNNLNYHKIVREGQHFWLQTWVFLSRAASMTRYFSISLNSKKKNSNNHSWTSEKEI